MRLPTLRLSLPRPSLEWLGALGGRITLLYVGYTAALFIVFLLVTFPHELLIRRALSNFNRGPAVVEFSNAGLTWLKGYEVNGMRIESTTDGQPPYLEFSHLWVRPALAALVRGNPYDLLMQADLYGGAAQGEINMVRGGVAGNLQWEGINIGRYRTLTSLLDEGDVAGRVSGQLNFEARGENFGAGQATGEMTIDAGGLTNAKISGFGIPDIHLRQTKMKFAVRSGHLEVQEFQTTGDVSIQGSGQIVLREPLQDSVLNLRATIETSLATPDAIKGAVALIPRAPGAKPDAPITLTGTLAHPRVR